MTEPGHEQAILIGGPGDGVACSVKGGPPQITYDASVGGRHALHGTLFRSKAYYTMLYSDGFPSRDDQGRLRYEYAGSSE